MVRASRQYCPGFCEESPGQNWRLARLLGGTGGSPVFWVVRASRPSACRRDARIYPLRWGSYGRDARTTHAGAIAGEITILSGSLRRKSRTGLASRPSSCRRDARATLLLRPLETRCQQSERTHAGCWVEDGRRWASGPLCSHIGLDSGRISCTVCGSRVWTSGWPPKD